MNYLQWTSANGNKHVAVHDTCLSELRLDAQEPCVPMLNLVYITRQDNMITMTWKDGSNRLIECDSGLTATKLQVALYHAAMSYTLEKINGLWHDIPATDLSQINQNTKCMHITRVPGVNHCDARPNWVWSVICLQINSDRIVYELGAADARKAFIKKHVIA
jgi:hypothetical protein